MIIYLRRFGMSPAELTSFNDMSVDTTDGRGGGGGVPPQIFGGGGVALL